MSEPDPRLDSPEGVSPDRLAEPFDERRPGVVRSLLLLTRMSLRRRFNRIRAAMASRGAKQSGPKDAARRATPRKPRGGGCLTVVFSVVFLLNSGFIANRFLENLSGAPGQSESADPETRNPSLDLLRSERQSLLEQGRDLSNELGRINEERQRLEARLERSSDAPETARLRRELAVLDHRRHETEAQLDRLARDHAEIQAKMLRLLPSEAPGGESDGSRGVAATILTVGLILVLLCIGVVFSVLGNRNPDLGQVEWSLEWLFTFPISTRVLFAAKLAEYTVSNFLGWFVFSPLLLLYFARAGFGFPSLFLAIGGTLYLNLIIGAFQLVGETWLRKRLDRPRLKNRQALCTVVGILLLLTVFALAMTPGGVPVLRGLVNEGARPLLVVAPPSSLALVAFGGSSGWLAAGVTLAYVLFFGYGAVRIAERLVRGGLVTEGGAYAGTRVTVHAAEIARPGWFRGVVAKDLRLLWRDRNLFVQTLVVPLVIIGFQIAVNAELLEAIRTKFNHAAVAAFGLGAYALMFSAVNALVVEGKAFWLLFTVPEPIERTILRKALLWGTFASLAPTAFLVWALSRPGAVTAENLLTAGVVIAGIYIYAIIGAAIGSLATDLFEEEVRRRIRPSMLYLFMFLAGLYGYAVYAPAAWHRVAMLVLSASLAYAAWQKLRDQAAYLLDPTQSAPRRLSLSDGLIAALVLFVLQGLIGAVMKSTTDLAQGALLVIAYAVAGSLVVLGSLLVFEIRGIPAVVSVSGKPGRFTPGSVLEGIGLGLWALGVGLAYTVAIEFVEPLRRLKESIPHLTQVAAESRWWFAALVILIAPPVEEFIFRGLVYRGLRRSARPGVAVLLSAAIFAVCHPPISFVPVFILGVVTAIALERRGRLAVPMLIHAVYNGGVLLLGG